MKYEIKNRWSGAVQFTAEIKCKKTEIESIKIGLAVKWAVKNDANLCDANLCDANLSGANLCDANLCGGAKAYGYTFTQAPIQIFDKYIIEIWQGFMKIGCEKHTLAEWKAFSQKCIIEMDGKDAAVWWKKWKPALFALAEAGDRLELPEQENDNDK